MPLVMIRNDITKVQADALVNPANEDLLEGSGTSRAIYLAAGEEKLAGACREIGHCDIGKAVLTEAFDLPARYVIHAVGPVWKDGKHGEPELLYSAYMESLLLAERQGLESIAFPLLSSGNYGYPKAQAMRTAIGAISDFLMENEMMVYLVLYDRSSVSVSKKLFVSVEEYIDDHYVDTNDEGVWGDRSYPVQMRRGVPCGAEPQAAASMPKAQAPVKAEVPAFSKPAKTGSPKPAMAASPERSLESLMEHMDETFSQMLLRLIDERDLKDSYVYKKANIDRRHFSKIRNDVNYAPNKKTVLAFAIALELTLDETRDLLRRAGFALSNSSKSDVIICFFIENQRYDIFEINEMLFAYGQPTLGE